MDSSNDLKTTTGVDRLPAKEIELAQVQPELDPAIDKRVTQKFDTHIIPWLFGIWYASLGHTYDSSG